MFSLILPKYISNAFAQDIFAEATKFEEKNHTHVGFLNLGILRVWVGNVY